MNYQQKNILDNAAELAQFHNWLGLRKKGKSLLPNISRQSAYIKQAYSKINEYYYRTEDSIPSAEWYLDNYYLINELIKELMKDLSKQFESKLLYVAAGDLAGYPRIYLIISEYIKSKDNELNFEQLKQFICQYQIEAPLSSAEIWTIPIMLKIIMLEQIFYQVERILFVQQERTLAENWLDAVFGQERKEMKTRSEELDVSGSYSTVYIERIAKRLKEYGSDGKILLNWLDNIAQKQNMTVEKVVATEQYYLASYGAAMGNIIATIKLINSENWSEFFEKVSLVQQILERDPAGIFVKMDFESRDKYRHEIESLARAYNVSELTVAKTIEQLAQSFEKSPENHVGFYLLGAGKTRLEKELTATWGRVRRSFHGLCSLYRTYPTASYFGMIAALTLLPFFGFLLWIRTALAAVSPAIAFLFILAALILFNGIGVYATNRLFCKCIKTTFLPKLDLSGGIPDDFKTVVVIPVIFNHPDKVRDQLQQLENHFINNRGKNLFFAILGDFNDAPTEKTPQDDKILEAGIKGVKRLNKKYGEECFFYFHRSRKWNERDRIWMGWERKRGKLIEFNRLLLQERETSYTTQVGNLDLLKNVRYVITLDADTILPRNAASRLIGTIAHPMQKAQLATGKRKVKSGYGIIQPRIGLTASSAFATPFSAIFTGSAGIDPYTCAISDIYQDLFDEGIYTGKGIYDLEVFHSVTADYFPENKILSHDLIEGLLARTALATDIELFDGCPTKYLAFAKRSHRWIRGDWQIAPYLFSKNLAAVSRWKIFDNLRRSLEVPLQLLVLFLAFTVLYKAFAALLSLVLLCLGLPFILSVLGMIINHGLTPRIIKYLLKVELSQIAFSLAVMPYECYLHLDAVVRSLYRQFIGKRFLLEWETAADSERSLCLKPAVFYRTMLPGIVLSLVFFLGYLFVPAVPAIILSVLILIWLASPWLAYRLSLPFQDKITISKANELELRKWARRIWAFFAVFVNQENHYLPPDNIQLEPYKGAASRTSPTNIGLAMLANLAAADFGYLTKEKLLRRVSQTLGTIRKLPKWNGHIYNWYDTKTLEPLHPIYISTVDSGNFATYLIALKNGLQEIPHKPVWDTTYLQGLEDTWHLLAEENESSISELAGFDQEIKRLYNFSGQEQLQEVYAFTVKWLLKLTACEKGGKTGFWTSALQEMLRDCKHVLDNFFPFLSDPESFAAFFKQYPDLDPFALNTKALARIYAGLLRKNADKLSGEKILPLRLKRDLSRGVKRLIILLLRAHSLQKELERIAYGMDFKPLFDQQKKIFSIGYNLTEQKLDKSYYDLLASEARQTSLFSIAKGDIPESHWFKTSRPLTKIGRYRSLVSWSGTMFEFLMPLILFKNYRGTLLDETYQAVVKIQQAYGQKGKTPWGISESGFFSFDIQSNYQYKAFGVPGLGLKRGLAKDIVISPYSAFLAISIDPEGSLNNLLLLKKMGANGRYGLYEAIDFTKARVPYNEQYSIVKSYMAHHQGMSLLSLNNALKQNILQKRFHREPVIRSVELLLQEQVPLKEYTFNPIIEEVTEEKIPVSLRQKGEKPVVYYTANSLLPRTAFVANREYSVMLTLSGSGYSRYKDIFVSRWREDATLDTYGTFVYVQNLNSGDFWSSTAKPLDYAGEDYQVTFFPNTVKYARRDGNILTQTTVFVAPVDPVEVRKISLTNLSPYTRDIQLTSYLEVVLEKLSADMAHPAFSKLFIQTAFEQDTLLAFRRPRTAQERGLFLMHALFSESETLGELQYETDRTKFIGRGKTLANPKALDFNQPLSKSVGAVLDPILSLRTTVSVKPGQTIHVYFLTGIGESKEQALSLAEKYKSVYTLNQAKDLAWSQNLMELTNLNLTFEEATMYSELAGQVVFAGPARLKSPLAQNTLGQSALWPYGISGDRPIVLLKIQHNSQHKLVDEMLKIHAYWKIKGLSFDLVVLNEDQSNYFQSVQESIQEKISTSHVRRLINQPGGVFLLKKQELAEETLILLHIVARLVFTGEEGKLIKQVGKLLRWRELYTESIQQPQAEEEESASQPTYIDLKNEFQETLHYFNGYGGFSKDGREYWILVDHQHPTPLPWSNILANPEFGTLLTEAGASYTWSQNSREHKLSPWSNDPLLDTSGEAVYLKDKQSGRSWSPLPQPKSDSQPYVIRYGQGYTVYTHNSQEIRQETTIFVPLQDSLKVVELKLTNTGQTRRSLSAYYYLEWVLGVQRENNVPYLLTEEDQGILFCRNIYQEEFWGRTAFLGVYGGALQSFTCDRQEFIGKNSSLRQPVGLKKENLANRSQALDPCAVIQIDLVLEPLAEKKVVFLIGDASDKDTAKNLVRSYQNEEKLAKARQEVDRYWDRLLSTIEVKTPEKTFDLLFNRWLIYQTLTCRIWARTAFYQAGGAFGFRDQLQDVMPFAVLKPEIARKQIILHSSRQFPEGDVQHWWHREKGKGIRTKFTDDLLWLPYVTADYVEHTGDYSVLDEKTPFLQQECLAEGEDECYAVPQTSSRSASVYEHCILALEHSLRFGEHGLPLIGTGDWNDGFSAIGREGRGESVWLGWFLLAVLKSFLPLCLQRGETARAEKYQKVIEDLTENMEKNAWDGAWYRRAYFDDGTPVGSASSPECQLDSIAQSWAVLSGSARESRVRDAVSAMERYLWDRENGLFKLFTPPFDLIDKNPGYIKGYIPGVRENGGQYTHAAIWSVLAYAKLKDKDKALELFNMLNPINHARTALEAARYKAEPYVVAADIYSVYPNIGRGGWTWYTGAAGWMYQAALKGVLGLTLKGDQLDIDPCVPSSWKEFTVKYRYKETRYTLLIRPGSERQVVLLDGAAQPGLPLRLTDDGREHLVEISII